MIWKKSEESFHGERRVQHSFRMTPSANTSTCSRQPGVAGSRRSGSKLLEQLDAKNDVSFLPPWQGRAPAQSVACCKGDAEASLGQPRIPSDGYFNPALPLSPPPSTPPHLLVHPAAVELLRGHVPVGRQTQITSVNDPTGLNSGQKQGQKTAHRQKSCQGWGTVSAHRTILRKASTQQARPCCSQED